MDVYKNSKNRMIDSFHTTKWIFNEIQELKYRVSSRERKNYNLKNRVIEDEKIMDNIVEEVKNRVQMMESSMHIIVEQSYNILKEANENINMIIDKVEEHSTSKAKELIRHSAKDRTLEDSLRKCTRSSMRKKDILELDKDLLDMKEVAGRLLELEISAMEILREITCATFIGFLLTFFFVLPPWFF